MHTRRFLLKFAQPVEFWWCTCLFSCLFAAPHITKGFNNRNISTLEHWIHRTHAQPNFCRVLYTQLFACSAPCKKHSLCALFQLCFQVTNNCCKLQFFSKKKFLAVACFARKVEMCALRGDKQNYECVSCGRRVILRGCNLSTKSSASGLQLQVRRPLCGARPLHAPPERNATQCNGPEDILVEVATISMCCCPVDVA